MSFGLLTLIASLSAEDFIRVEPRIETGFVNVIQHLYRSGNLADGNNEFNYVKQGGQDVLFPFSRFTVDTVISEQHRVTALYQPLTIQTKSIAGRNNTGSVQVDNIAYPDGTPLDLTYGFDFFRLSYLYDFLPAKESALGLGLSLQLRNANIVFSSADGTLRSVQNNIGPVPIIKVLASHDFGSLGVYFEADGFYASSAFFNGSGRPFEGWIWDGAVRAEVPFTEASAAFVSVRTIGGGASGTNAYDYRSATTSNGGETYNALATLALSLGVRLR